MDFFLNISKLNYKSSWGQWILCLYEENFFLPNGGDFSNKFLIRLSMTGVNSLNLVSYTKLTLKSIMGTSEFKQEIIHGDFETHRPVPWSDMDIYKLPMTV